MGPPKQGNGPADLPRVQAALGEICYCLWRLYQWDLKNTSLFIFENQYPGLEIWNKNFIEQICKKILLHTLNLSSTCDTKMYYI